MAVAHLVSFSWRRRASSSASTAASFTSVAGVGPADGVLGIRAKPSATAKCGRCWHYSDTVGSVAGSPDVCARCAGHLRGETEARQWV